MRQKVLVAIAILVALTSIVLVLDHYVFGLNLLETAQTVIQTNLLYIAYFGAFFVTSVVLLPFVAWALSTWNLFFTTCPSGNMKFVMKGETIHAIIYNEEDIVFHGYKKWNLEPEGFRKRSRWLFGLFWVGIPGLFRIHEFPITKDSENPDAGEDPRSWITQRGETMVDSLRLVMQRSFVFRNLELKDRSTVNILVTTKLRVLDWFIPIFNLKGKFFENTAGLIEAAVGDILKELTLQELIEAKKGERVGILHVLEVDGCTFAGALKAQVGLDLEGIAISRVDPGDAEIRKAMNARVLAEKEGEATVARSEADGKAAIIKAEADAKARERLAIARGEEIKQTVAAFGSPEAAAAVLRAEQLAKSNITTLVEGGGAPPVLPIGGGK